MTETGGWSGAPLVSGATAGVAIASSGSKPRITEAFNSVKPLLSYQPELGCADHFVPVDVHTGPSREDRKFATPGSRKCQKYPEQTHGFY